MTTYTGLKLEFLPDKSAIGFAVIFRTAAQRRKDGQLRFAGSGRFRLAHFVRLC